MIVKSPPILSESGKSRFWNRVKKSNGCWLWKGALNESGYGRFGIGGDSNKDWLAHRVSWVISFGSIPDGMFICHHCDTPSCVNPAHLFLGTGKDNHEDAVKKGRKLVNTLDYWRKRHPDLILRGEQNSCVRLTEEDVIQMRRLHATGIARHKLARLFRVSQTAAAQAILRKTWKHVK